MKKLFHAVSIAIISLCLGAGCAGKLAVKEHSGFLGDYSKLQQGPEGGVDQRYIKEGVNFKQYNKISDGGTAAPAGATVQQNYA